MNRLLEESLGRGRPAEPLLASGSWIPLADLYETGEAFVVQIELPGLDRDDIEVQVDADAVTVRGERRAREASRPECFHRMERSHGPFARSFKLAEEVDPSRVTAQFRDGLLRLDVPKAHPRPPARRG